MESTGVTKLSERIQYTFSDPDLLNLALTHKSFANENSAIAPHHNERLEFLGDAILDFVISDLLMAAHSDLPEGDLSKLRANLVNERGLADMARELKLGQYLRLGHGEQVSAGHEKDSIISDALEALFAAIYADSKAAHGTAEIYRVIQALFHSRLSQISEREVHSDYKTALQERMQKSHKENVAYHTISEQGPDHDKQFEVAVTFRDEEIGRGVGRSKKQAEQAAAQAALQAAPGAGYEASP